MRPPSKRTGGFRGKGPNGRNLCFCGCGNEVSPPRVNWFNDEHWVRNVPQFMRRRVFNRDHGICAICKADTLDGRRKLKSEFEIYEEGRERNIRFDQQRMIDQIPKPPHNISWHELYLEASKNFPFEKRFDAIREGKSPWQMDHIVPVVEGGGNCGLENYRTLCIPCHLSETRKLAARLAEKRRLQKQPELKI